MALTINSEQVLALAPDASAAQAGRKLANPRQWRGLGYNDQALWGECQGSALYQVRADLVTLSVKCSCPSRKFPCKHGLGLLLLGAASPDALAEGEPPEWVASWLAKRAASAASAATRAEAPAASDSAQPPDNATSAASAAAAAKSVARRERRIAEGLDTLDLWLSDLIRNGLGSLESQSDAFWANQAARLVDAQAPGLAARVRAMSGLVHASDDWPQRTLDALGQLALLTHAYRQQEALDHALRDDVRQLIGWTLTADEVAARGEHLRDDWLTLGQWIDDSERVRAQRTWLLGAQSGRLALVVQFSAAGQPFGELIPPGMRFTGELHFWPGAYPLRARVASRGDSPPALATALPAGRGHASVEALLSAFAEGLARQPWLDRLGCALRDVTLIPQAEGAWLARDHAGAALPLTEGEHWRLLALSGGAPVDLLGEWDGERLLPLGVFAEGEYAPLWGVNA